MYTHNHQEDKGEGPHLIQRSTFVIIKHLEAEADPLPDFTSGV